jgi:ribosomal protein S18 acetylase RimI-like enzyme
VTVEFELRPARESDREPLYAVHCATMRDVITRTWGWDEAWQRANFDGRFDPSKVSIVSAGGRDVGSVWLEIRPGELYVAELQIVPEMQGRGLGSAVLRGVVASAAARGACVTLQVLDLNVRARRLYERLGFYVTGETDRYVTDRHVQMRHDAGTPRGG